jgi:4-hydroxybenzoate polyprenyltransferase
MSVRKIRNYLTLVRFPNLFTLPSNVLLGFFSTQSSNAIEVNAIVLLILVSACLYAVGVIFNDIADRQIDRKERPNRPIPSGKIKQRNATILAMLLIAISIIVSNFISPATLTVVFVLITTIFLYDFVLKNSVLGPAAMAATRVLNILLGASLNMSNFIGGETYNISFRLCLVCISEFIYVSGISALSKYETHLNTSFQLGRLHALLFLSPLIIGVYAASIGLFSYNIWIYLLIFGSFIVSILKVTTHPKFSVTNPTLQRIIGLLIAGIIVHDAIYIGGSLDIWYLGMSTFVLLIPTILLGKRFYVT